MASDEVRMPVAAVAGHADSVDEAADSMETGRSAGTHVQLGHEAYGKICAFLPGLIDPVANATVEALAESSSALRETANNLRKAASRSDASDHAADRRVTGAGRHIELPL